LRWDGSDAKYQLEADLWDGTIPLTKEEMMPRVAYDLEDRPMFRVFPYPKFRTHLCNLRKKTTKAKQLGLDEEAMLAHDRQLYPTAAFNSEGKPRWEGSDAEASLKIDVANGKNLQMDPRFLHKSRDEYQVFDLEVFRKHIKQEEKRQKFIVYLKFKEKSDREKKAEANAILVRKQEREKRKRKAKKAAKKAKQEKAEEKARKKAAKKEKVAGKAEANNDQDGEQEASNIDDAWI